MGHNKRSAQTNSDHSRTRLSGSSESLSRLRLIRLGSFNVVELTCRWGSPHPACHREDPGPPPPREHVLQGPAPNPRPKAMDADIYESPQRPVPLLGSQSGVCRNTSRRANSATHAHLTKHPTVCFSSLSPPLSLSSHRTEVDIKYLPLSALLFETDFSH